MSADQRIRELDALRGIAACWVMLFHYLVRYDQLYGGTRPLFGGITFPDGLYGVHLFFMISGFVIFMTLRHCAGARDFVVSRFSRLYPAYWAALTVTGVLAVLVPLPDQTLSLRMFGANLTMLQSFLLVPALDGSYWSLAYELGFYAVMLALFVTGWLRRIELFCWVWLGLALAVHLPPPFTLPLPWRVMLVLALDYAAFFTAGIVFYLARNEGYTINRIALLVAALGVATVAAKPDEIPAPYMVLFFILFHLAAKGGLTRLAQGRVLLWLGAISYPLYLIHEMMGFRLLYALASWRVPPLAAVPLVIAVALAVATLISRTVEQPAMRVIRRAYRRIAAARVAPV